MNKIAAIIKNGLRTFSPTCREASRLQSEALDARLTSAKRVGLWLHLLICNWCRRYGRQIRFLRDSAHEHCDQLTEATPQALSAEARERIRERLKSGQ